MLLPFEPRQPTLPVLGFQITLLEAAAALAMLALGWANRVRLRELLAARPWLLLGLSAYALVHLASALWADDRRLEALKFSGRMAAMAAFGWVVAAAPASERRRGLHALVAAGVAVGCLAIAEGAGLRWLDPFLAHFREMPFNVGGTRRATAASEYPNQAAAFLTAALLVWGGLSAARGVALRAGVAGLLCVGLLFTYSRGALAAAALALAGAGVVLTGLRRPLRGVATALLVLAAATTAFAASGEIFRLRLDGEGTRGWYAARYEPQPAPTRLAPGAERRLRVRVANTGRKTWTRGEAFHLSYHWYDLKRRTLSDGERSVLPSDVAPGQAVVVDARVVAPRAPGRYLLIWDMVHEDTSWFSGQGVRPVSAEVVVGEAEPAPPPMARTPLGEPGWRPERRELWRLALAMWREHPLLGAGPDNFRWLHGRYAGQAFWDTRVFANNTLLEVAATTGGLGVMAIAFTYAAGLGAGYRWLRRAAPGSAEARQAAALGALWLGLMAHGTVDYLLAFTGHYLLFGLAAGALASGWREARLGGSDLP